MTTPDAPTPIKEEEAPTPIKEEEAPTPIEEEEAPTPIKEEEAEDLGNTLTSPNDKNYDGDTEADHYSWFDPEERSPRSYSAADWYLYPQESARTPRHTFDSTTERPTASCTISRSSSPAYPSLFPHGLVRTPGPPFDSEGEILPTTERPTASCTISRSSSPAHSSLFPHGLVRTPGPPFDSEEEILPTTEGPDALTIIGNADAVSIILGENADRATRIAPASIMYRNLLREDISDTDVEDWSQL